MSRAFNLFRLQQVDTQLDHSRARLAKIESLLNEDAIVRLARTALQASEEVQNTRKKSLATAEDNTRAQRLKIEQTENHLYSGRITNPKELQDYQNEVAALKRHLDTLEERQLEALLALDDAEAERASAQEAFDKVQAEKMRDNAALTGEQSELLAQVEKLTTERTVAMVSVQSEDRTIYEKLREQRNGVAVAEASGQSCAACGSSLHAALYQSARMSDQLAYCETCKRILYVG